MELQNNFKFIKLQTIQKFCSNQIYLEQKKG